MDTAFYTAFIVCLSIHVACGCVKLIFRPSAYRDNFKDKYPTWRGETAQFLSWLLLLPYAWRIGDDFAMRFVNVLLVLIYGLLMEMTCRWYYFGKRYTARHIVVCCAFVVAAIVIFHVQYPLRRRYVPVLLSDLVVLVLALWSVSRHVYMVVRVRKLINEANKSEYSNPADFPRALSSLAQYAHCIVVLVLVAVCIVNDPVASMVRDILFAVFGVLYFTYTLNPRPRPLSLELVQELIAADESAKSSEVPQYRLSEENFQRLSSSLDELMGERRMFTNTHLTAEDLWSELGTNRTYFSELVARSGYSSFYGLVNSYRVEAAHKMIASNPEMALSEVAEMCGFSSPSYMSRVFKEIKGHTPSQVRKSNEGM